MNMVIYVAGTLITFDWNIMNWDIMKERFMRIILILCELFLVLPLSIYLFFYIEDL